MKYANIGSISSGTLLPYDLIDAFAYGLEILVQQNAKEWCSDAGRSQKDSYMTLIGNARELSEDSDEIDYVLEELQDAMAAFAPPWVYFGAHPGDGADFGFWVIEDIDVDFDGLKVDDTAEVPTGFSGEVLHVNDHGNMTLYVADKGKLTEMWAIV